MKYCRYLLSLKRAPGFCDVVLCEIKCNVNRRPSSYTMTCCSVIKHVTLAFNRPAVSHLQDWTVFVLQMWRGSLGCF